MIICFNYLLLCIL